MAAAGALRIGSRRLVPPAGLVPRHLPCGMDDVAGGVRFSGGRGRRGGKSVSTQPSARPGSVGCPSIPLAREARPVRPGPGPGAPTSNTPRMRRTPGRWPSQANLLRVNRQRLEMAAAPSGSVRTTSAEREAHRSVRTGQNEAVRPGTTEGGSTDPGERGRTLPTSRGDPSVRPRRPESAPHCTRMSIFAPRATRPCGSCRLCRGFCGQGRRAEDVHEGDDGTRTFGLVLGRLAIAVRPMHPAWFPTRCGGRPAAVRVRPGRGDSGRRTGRPAGTGPSGVAPDRTAAGRRRAETGTEAARPTRWNQESSEALATLAD
jgi:hypothetical protein